MVIMMPKDENELRHMMKTALEYNDGPIAYRYPRINGTGVALDPELRVLPIGSWERLRSGDDYAVLACGPMVQVAEEAAEVLKREGIQVGIVNARFLKPLDNAMLLELAHVGTSMVVIEEASQAGSLGSAVLEFFSEQEIYDARVHLMGIPDIFIEHGSVKEQRQQTGLTVEALCARIKDMKALSKYTYKTTSTS
ncbi:1-deoxy-D-xylulose-5-phosphate synthase [compost metagenome]